MEKDLRATVTRRFGNGIFNQYHLEARELMINQAARRELDKNHPNPTWEGKIAEKMAKKNLSREEAIADIYATAIKSNAAVNKKLGLE